MTDAKDVMKLFSDTDESWEEVMARLTPEQLAAYSRHLYEMFMSDPDAWSSFTPEFVDNLRQNVESLEQANLDCDAAVRKSSAANAKRDRTASILDALLSDTSNDDTEH